jgi:O-acetyl-ADP-ribose deacetylase (regulator of RNase III)
MVTIRTGSLFESGAQTLVNAVNCMGVMGKGIALQFKRRFPEMYLDYRARCGDGGVKVGLPYLYRVSSPPWVLNFPTKEHWRMVARLSDITRGLEHLVAHYREWGIASLAVPALGCGQGQLEWRIVGPILVRYLSRIDIPVELFGPQGTPQHQLQIVLPDGPAPAVVREAAPGAEGRLNPAWVGLVEIVRRIGEQPYHWPVEWATFQGIAFVATEMGLPTGSTCQRSSHGPLCPELKRIFTSLANNGLIREEKRGATIAVCPGPAFEDAAVEYHQNLAGWEPILRRVADLFRRMDSGRAELVAAVMVAARDLRESTNRNPTEREVVRSLLEWNQRGRPSPDEALLANAVRNLAALGWLRVEPSEDLPFPEGEALAP